MFGFWLHIFVVIEKPKLNGFLRVWHLYARIHGYWRFVQSIIPVVNFIDLLAQILIDFIEKERKKIQAIRHLTVNNAI